MARRGLKQKPTSVITFQSASIPRIYCRFVATEQLSRRNVLHLNESVLSRFVPLAGQIKSRAWDP